MFLTLMMACGADGTVKLGEDSACVVVEGLLDADGDGFAGERTEGCMGDSFVEVGGDCDDEDPSVHPAAEEDCQAPGDEDCDGLLSCEDGDCEGQAPCAEGDCEDGLDGDDDGDADCDDEDCWTDPACLDQVGIVVTGGEYLWVRAAKDLNVYQYGSAYYGFSGELRLYGDFGTTTCDWSHQGGYAVAYLYSGQEYHSSYFDGPATTGGDCPVDSFSLPRPLFMGGPGYVSHSQGVWFRHGDEVQSYKGTYSGYVYTAVYGDLSTGDVFVTGPEGLN